MEVGAAGSFKTAVRFYKNKASGGNNRQYSV
jgi:hypothetical protein